MEDQAPFRMEQEGPTTIKSFRSPTVAEAVRNFDVAKAHIADEVQLAALEAKVKQLQEKEAARKAKTINAAIEQPTTEQVATTSPTVIKPIVVKIPSEPEVGQLIPFPSQAVVFEANKPAAVK
jgi:hypothetical protein